MSLTRSFRHPGALVALFTLFVACDPDDTESAPPEDSQTALGATGGGEDSGDGGEGDQDEPQDSQGSSPTLLLECGIDPACDALLLDPAAIASASADARCLFTALGAGEPTLLQTLTLFDRSVANLDLAILSPGEVLRQTYGASVGLGEWINPVMRCTLRSPDFFAACAADLDPSCLDPEQWFLDCEEEPTLHCPAL
jgi:hypothetical protein